MPDPQFFADFLQEPIVRGDRKVSNLDLGRVAATGRRASRDDGNSAFTATRDQKAFARGTVDGIEHELEFGLQNFRGIRFEKE